MPEERLLSQLKRLFIGRPIPTRLAHHQRFSRVTGLAVLSSDALSSVAYATEEILRVLIVGGLATLSYATPIALCIALLLAIVVFSYRQTIHAYPNGGGAYIVARENLGRSAGLIAAASLLIDYTMTVAVSVAAGVAAITSAVPSLQDDRVLIALVCVVALAVGNLRGIRESGRLFAGPTYFFIGSILVLLGIGAVRYATGSLMPLPPEGPIPTGAEVHALGLFAILTAFSNGCTAMTGVEAVSNGVPAFRDPTSKNAASTLGTMAVLAITMFVGITLLAHAYHIVPSDRETVISQIARALVGGRNAAYYAVQIATMLILVLAANTAYADFPRLASVVSADGFLPRQFMNQGDRLAFSNGILVLSAFASLLLIVFHGDTHALIPLYMIGVFVSFTLSQAGMVRHWHRLREGKWRTNAIINGTGAVLTGIVLIIVATTKAAEGAWIVLVLIPCLVMLFRMTRTHYDHVASQLSIKDWAPEPAHANIVVVPVSGIHRGVLKALEYARSLSPEVLAAYVDVEPVVTAKIRQDWERWGEGVKLVVLESPYRSIMEPLLEFIEQLQASHPDSYLTVLLPEFVPKRWWQALLHNQRALLIKGALLFQPNIIVTSVPYHLH